MYVALSLPTAQLHPALAGRLPAPATYTSPVFAGQAAAPTITIKGSSQSQSKKNAQRHVITRCLSALSAGTVVAMCSKVWQVALVLANKGTCPEMQESGRAAMMGAKEVTLRRLKGDHLLLAVVFIS